MTDYETFPTRADAVKRCRAMRGWPHPEPVDMYLPESPHANAEGNTWCICVDGAEAVEAQTLARFLRSDGYVR